MDKIREMLKSVRFWYAVALAIATFLEKAEIIPDAIATATQIFTVLGIGVRTYDRTVDKINE